VSTPPKLDFARIRQYRRDIDPSDADESDDEGNDGLDNDLDLASPTEDEDPWDWDINLDSQLLLSTVMGSDLSSSVAEVSTAVLGSSERLSEAGEWSEIEF
jgi:hypothetical protein